jgi:hypothetical protein
VLLSQGFELLTKEHVGLSVISEDQRHLVVVLW